jgi:hypothetical protein
MINMIKDSFYEKQETLNDVSASPFLQQLRKILIVIRENGNIKPDCFFSFLIKP